MGCTVGMLMAVAVGASGGRRRRRGRGSLRRCRGLQRDGGRLCNRLCSSRLRRRCRCRQRSLRWRFRWRRERRRRQGLGRDDQPRQLLLQPDDRAWRGPMSEAALSGPLRNAITIEVIVRAHRVPATTRSFMRLITAKHSHPRLARLEQRRTNKEEKLTRERCQVERQEKRVLTRHWRLLDVTSRPSRGRAYCQA